MRFIPGVEITCEVEITSDKENPSSWHLLAYFPDGASDEFSEWLVGLKEARLPRMKLMLEAMKELGHDIPIEDVEKFADGALGRPHLARAMIEREIVETVSQAFDEYIGNGAPAFRERPLPTVAEAVQMVHQSGGITSLAHPLYYGISNDIFTGLIYLACNTMY